MAQNDINATPVVVPPKLPTPEEEMAMMGAEDTKAHQEIDDFGIFIDRFHRNGDELKGDFAYASNGILMDAFIIQMLKKYKSDCFMVLDYGLTQKQGRKDRHYENITIDMPLVKYSYTKNKADTSSSLSIPDDKVIWRIGNAMKHCIANKTPIIIIPFTIHHHQNALIYRTKDNTLERFEPHGEGTHATMATNLSKLSYDERNAKLDELIREIFITRMNVLAKRAKTTLLPSGLVYLNAKHINPGRGFQSIEGDQARLFRSVLGYTGPEKEKEWEARFPGFCMIWAMYYMELVLANPTMSGKDLTEKAMKYLKDKGEHGLFIQILGYTKHIETELRKLVNEDLNMTSAHLDTGVSSHVRPVPRLVYKSKEYKAFKTKKERNAFIEKYNKEHPEWKDIKLNKEAIWAKITTFIKNDMKSIHAEFIKKMPVAPFPEIVVSEATLKKKAEKEEAQKEKEKQKALSVHSKAVEKAKATYIVKLKEYIKKNDVTVAKLRKIYDKKNDDDEDSSDAWGNVENAMFLSADAECEITRINAGLRDAEFGGSKPPVQLWRDDVSYKLEDEVLYPDKKGNLRTWMCATGRMYLGPNGDKYDDGRYLDFHARKKPGDYAGHHSNYWDMEGEEDD